MGSVPLASLPWRDGLCYTTTQRVAFGVLNWMVWIFLGGRWGCIDDLAGCGGLISLGVLVGFMLATCWAR